jgi:hypothetical protein
MSEMRRRWTLGGAIILLATALAACGSSQTSSTPTGATATSTGSSSATSSASSRPQAAAGACAPSQLAASYAGTQGATGHLEVTLALRNVSHSQCVVRGYPGVRLEDRSGRTLPLRVQQGHGFFPDTMSAPRPVSLAPGATAHFGVSFVTNNEYAGARVCRRACCRSCPAPRRPIGRGCRSTAHRASPRAATSWWSPPSTPDAGLAPGGPRAGRGRRGGYAARRSAAALPAPRNACSPASPAQGA